MGAYRSKSLTLFLRNKFRYAIDYFNNNGKSEESNGNTLRAIECSLWKARFTILTGNYIHCDAELISLYQRHKKTIDNHEYLRGLYTYLKANIHYYLGNHEESLKSAKTAKSCFNKAPIAAKFPVEYLLSLQMIAKAYWKKRDITKALITLLEGAKLNASFENQHFHFALAKNFNLIGSILMDVRRIEEATPFLEISRKIYDSHCNSLDKEHLYLGILHSNLAECVLRQEGTREQIEKKYQEHYLTASEIFGALYQRSPHRYSASLLKIEARYLKSKKKPAFKRILTVLDQEIKMREEAFKGSKHYSIARAYNNKSRIFIKIGEYQNAIRNAHYALLAAVDKFNNTNLNKNPKIDKRLQGFSTTEMLKALGNKAEAFFKLYQAKGNIKHLNRASNAIKTALNSTYHILSYNLSHTESKFLFLEDTRSLNELAVEILYEINNIPKKKVNIFYKGLSANKLYQLIQYNKSLLLLAELNSDHYRTGEPHNKNEYVQNVRMVEEMHASAHKILKEFNSGKSQAFLEQELEVLLQKLNGRQAYFKPKEHAQIDNKNLESLQEEMSNGKVATLEFFVGKHHLYGILLNDSLIKVRRLDHKPMSVKKIKKTVRLYENLLSVNIPTAKNTPQFERYMPIDVEDIKRKFITLSNKLYGILMEPFHGELSETERIYLIPDDFLWRLPFETLIDNINYDLAYNQLSYLQNKWLISYHFSLPLIHYLYIENKEKRREKTIQSIMIAVSDQGNLSDIEYDAILNWQDMMNPKLPTIIGELCPEGVSPVQALRDIPSEIVLIWAHGELNEGIRIREEERITMSDIQAGKKLNWKLLIVPNCHVGHGLLRDGEGMISLHRSFFSSGVENIIFPVNKLKAQGAIYVLNEFFNLLSDSEPVLISKALQQAKIKVSKREGSVPSDWAGLLFTGHQKDHINNSPPRNKGRILDFCSKFIQRSLKIKR